jgi:hypothetical protein
MGAAMKPLAPLVIPVPQEKSLFGLPWLGGGATGAPGQPTPRAQQAPQPYTGGTEEEPAPSYNAPASFWDSLR